ncbi:uncharacterized protein NPIL_291121 [Nephila pilipes]|uniref:Uncharacterized protein n=1 Tax=Nephila pilipes TaxID=299642 RepID=A0A8X6P0H4_NEPPI|nr:uncharacterized protein NPIL_291121 [Nephila pilipes]
MLFVPSLEIIAAVKIALALYNDCEIQQMFKETDLWLTSEEEWKSIIRKKMPDHLIPKIIKEKIIRLMKPIDYEVQMWKKQHETFMGEIGDRKIQFHWKPDGTIDRLKTANTLIQSDILKIEDRVRLACNYWHNESVIPIWNQLLGKHRKHFFLMCMRRTSDLLSASDRNVIQWIRRNIFERKKNSRKFKLIYFNWDCVSLQGLLPQNLTSEERLQIIRHTLKREDELHDGRFCVLLMAADQRINILKLNPYKVLRSFLLWPGQCLFIQMANHVRHDLSKIHFVCLLHTIFCQKIVPNFQDFEYVELLKEFLPLIPNDIIKDVEELVIYKLIKLAVDSRFSVLPELKRYLLHSELDVADNAKMCNEQMIEDVAFWEEDQSDFSYTDSSEHYSDSSED